MPRSQRGEVWLQASERACISSFKFFYKLAQSSAYEAEEILMSVAAKIIFVAYEQPLWSEIRDGLMPYFSPNEAVLHGNPPMPQSCAETVQEEKHLHDSLKQATFLIVGLGGFTPNEFWAISSAHVMRRPCGLILKSQDRSQIAALSIIHDFIPFRFVVSFGSLRRDRQLKELFSGTPYVWDVASLVEPGKEIAEFIRRQCA